MNTNRHLFNMAMMGAMYGVKAERWQRVHTKTTRRVRAPWDDVQLTKAERRGKTPDQIQALRALKWQQQQEAQHADSI